MEHTATNVFCFEDILKSKNISDIFIHSFTLTKMYLSVYYTSGPGPTAGGLGVEPGGSGFCPPALVAESLSRVRLCKPMDSHPPGSSVHGILQARMLEWVAIPFSRGSS